MGWIRIERSDVANYAQSDQIIGQPVAEGKGGFGLNGVMSLAMLNRIGWSIRLHGAMFFANQASRIEWSIRHRVSCSSGRFSIEPYAARDREQRILFRIMLETLPNSTLDRC